MNIVEIKGAKFVQITVPRKATHLIKIEDRIITQHQFTEILCEELISHNIGFAIVEDKEGKLSVLMRIDNISKPKSSVEI